MRTTEPNLVVWSMSRAPNRSMPSAGGRTPFQSLNLKDFGRRLAEIRTRLGMSQSDVARATWGTYINSKGKEEVRNRDRISKYEMGVSMPEPQSLTLLCDALGVSVEELAPSLVADTVERERDPAIQIVGVTGHLDKMHVRINTLIPIDMLPALIKLVEDAVKRVGDENLLSS